MSSKDAGLRSDMCDLWLNFAAPDGRDSVLRAGYLMKKPSNNKFGSRRKRYFILLQRALIYYENCLTVDQWNHASPLKILVLGTESIVSFDNRTGYLTVSGTSGQQNGNIGKDIRLEVIGSNIDETKEWFDALSLLMNEIKSGLTIGKNGEFQMHVDKSQLYQNRQTAHNIFGDGEKEEDIDDNVDGQDKPFVGQGYENEGQVGINENDMDFDSTYIPPTNFESDEEDEYDAGDGKMLYAGNTFVGGNTYGSDANNLKSMQQTMGNTFIIDDQNLDDLYG